MSTPDAHSIRIALMRIGMRIETVSALSTLVFKLRGLDDFVRVISLPRDQSRLEILHVDQQMHVVGGWIAKLLVHKCTLGADMRYTVHTYIPLRDSFYTSSIAENYARLP